MSLLCGCRMAQQLLQKSFESSLALPEQPAAALELAWPVAILQHTFWYTTMSVAVNLLGVKQVVQDIQQHMVHAVRTPHALEHICRMLAGVIVAAGGSADAVLSMVSRIHLVTWPDFTLNSCVRY